MASIVWKVVGGDLLEGFLPRLNAYTPPVRSCSCGFNRPQDGLQQVVVVARASLYRERFDLGGRNSSLAQSPLHALDNGERIFILADQGDADVRIFAAHVSPNRADRVAIDDRDHARPLVLPQWRFWLAVFGRLPDQFVTPLPYHLRRSPRRFHLGGIPWVISGLSC
jgi:hypothetical protein